MLKQFAAAALLAACPFTTFAQEVGNPPRDKPQGDASVVVHGQRDRYRSLTATGATRTDALLRDLPQSVRVITPELLRDAGAVNLAGALEMASGVARQSDLGGLWDSYAMRGFTGDPNFGADYLVNGFSASRGYNGVRDLAGTESIEVLKGPASALYGRGEPGGTVNIVTRKPRFVHALTGSIGIGSFDTRRAAIDATGPLAGNLAYRLNAAMQEGNSVRDTSSRKRTMVSPSIIWTPGEGTTVSYEIAAARQEAPFDRGVLAVGGKLGLIPASRFLGEPGDGPITVRSLGQQLFVQHDLDASWSLQAGLSWRDSGLTGFSSEASALQADQRTLRRQRRYRDFSASDLAGRVELLGKFSTASLRHQVLLGADAYRFNDHRIQLRRNPSAATPYAIDIYQPVYGGGADALAPAVDTLERQRAHGLYLQDQVELGTQWKLLAGLRADRDRQRVDNLRLGVRSSQEGDAVSPRAGLVFQPTPAWSLYLSSARGYRPNSGISIDNRSFDAEKSNSRELGAKYERADGKLSATLALYKIGKKNVLTTNPVNTDFSVPAGEVASKGLEFDAAGELARGLRLSAAYAYTDAVVTRGDRSIVTGSRFPNVARHSASLLLVSDLRLGDAAASAGAGLVHVGKRLGDVATSSSFTLPAYTTARFNASYAASRALRLSLNIDNLFDKVYFASSYSQLWVAPGAARTAMLTLDYRFQ